MRWNERFHELQAYKNEFGDCLVPTKYSPNLKLARWVGNQRAHYRLYIKAKEAGTTDSTAGGMSEERIERLESLGFCWNARPDSVDGASWNLRFQELSAFREEHGNCEVPRNYPQNQSLANWVSNQRTHYKLYVQAQESGDSDTVYTFMTAERVAQLESVGFTWTVRKRRPKKGSVAASESVEMLLPAPAGESKEGVWEL